MTSDGQQQNTVLPAVHEAWLPREHSLHRPRHGTRQLTALVCALVFFTAPTFMWMFGMRPTELENHQLAAFPSVTDGWGLFTGMHQWATDNLVFRAGAIDATDWVSRTFFGEAAPFDQGGGPPGGPLPGGPADEVGTPPDEPGVPSGADSAGYRRVIEGSDGWLYFGFDVLGKCQPKRTIDDTVRQLNRLREAVEASGRRFVLVSIPDKTTMVPEHLPGGFPGKDCAGKATPVFWRKVTTLAQAMDMRPALHGMADRIGHPVYFPQDSHWTHEGALAMITEVAERIRPGITTTWKLEPRGSQSATADLPPLIGRAGKHDAMTYRMMPDGVTDRAQVGVRDLRRPVHRTSSPGPGMITTPTVVLGDSFSLAASSYLPAAFTDVTQLNYSTIAADPALVAGTVGNAEVVVVPVVERNLASGTAELLDQGFIDRLRQELAKRPVR